MRPEPVPTWLPREISAHIDAVQAAGWTPGRDLVLVEAILKGAGGLDRAVAATGKDREACLARWFALYPREMHSIDNQGRFASVIRERARVVA